MLGKHSYGLLCPVCATYIFIDLVLIRFESVFIVYTEAILNFPSHPIFLENSGFLELATLLCNKPILWPPRPPMLRPPPPPK